MSNQTRVVISMSRLITIVIATLVTLGIIVTTLMILVVINKSNIQEQDVNSIPLANWTLPSYDVTDIISEYNWSQNELLWENAMLPFIIDERLSHKQKIYITSMYEYYYQNTKIRLVPYNRSMHNSFVVFLMANNPECEAYAGRKVGWQRINVGTECSVTALVHEVMHTLGWHHEHSRPDRNEYIRVNYENIPPGLTKNFDVRYSIVYEKIESKTPYDYRSIMHYSRRALGNGKVTMEFPKSYDAPRLVFSETDLLELDMYYNLTTNK